MTTWAREEPDDKEGLRGQKRARQAQKSKKPGTASRRHNGQQKKRRPTTQRRQQDRAPALSSQPCFENLGGGVSPETSLARVLLAARIWRRESDMWSNFDSTRPSKEVCLFSSWSNLASNRLRRSSFCWLPSWGALKAGAQGSGGGWVMGWCPWLCAWLCLGPWPEK